MFQIKRLSIKIYQKSIIKFTGSLLTQIYFYTLIFKALRLHMIEYFFWHKFHLHAQMEFVINRIELKIFITSSTNGIHKPSMPDRFHVFSKLGIRFFRKYRQMRYLKSDFTQSFSSNKLKHFQIRRFTRMMKYPSMLRNPYQKFI